LKKHACLSTFFLIGDNITQASRPLVQQMISDGHLVGNHTMSHDSKLAPRELRSEIEKCDEILREFYGDSAPKPIPFRLPFGIRTYVAERMENGKRVTAAALDQRIQVLASMGRTHVHWTMILPDWQARSQNDADQLVKLALGHAEQMHDQGLDAVFAMHDGSPQQNGVTETREWTVYAVDKILEHARVTGWQTFQAPAR